MTPMRLTHATSLILLAMARGHRHGFQVMEVTGLPSGTVYPALRRLEAWGHVTSEWEDEDRAREDGRPPRRLYALTGTGLALADKAGARLAEARELYAPEPGGNGSPDPRTAGEA